jgi:Domain of unknown function (DUF4136)
MKTIPRVCISLALSLAPQVTTVALAQDSYDYRRDVNFANIRTFAFKATPPMDPVAAKTTTYDSPLVRDRTNAAIAAQLESRGMKRDDEHPDVYIVTHRTFELEYTYYGPYGYGWGPYAGFGYGAYYPGSVGWGGWNGWNGGVYAQLEGTLTVDVEDAKSGALLWRGVETKRVHETSKPEKRDKRVFKEVSDVFKHFPTPGVVATTGER